METDYATWEPCNSWQEHWSMEPAICPTVLHVESEASTDIFGSCLQASIPASSTTGGQLALFSAATPNDPIGKGKAQNLEVDHHNMEIRIQANPIYVFEKRAHEFKLDVDMMKTKIHRYPPTIRALGGLYTVPKTVAIGPYHHNRDHLKAAEKVKHVAAYHCIRESGRSVQEICHAVVSAAGDAYRLYDTGAYMLTCTRAGLAQMDPALRSFFDSNVYRDIMLLKNQLPWTELINMGVKKKGNLFADLSLAPLSLDNTRASLLLNMAAFEPNFRDADDEDSAVCSYLLLLGMIVDREEDVHELRRRILQGGGGHHNKEALDFLTSLQGLRLGSRYVRTMEEIENYKVKRRTRTKVHAFVYRNIKTIVTVVSTVTALVGIVGTLKSLKVIQ
ncbi:unnamed protein product [Urochloa decumbens]|uniref:Uncharacterized protein n=1 Tax=Urochloa decumbens TaxID=240449 RepID=A0ABC9ASQ0_9POAL